MIRALLALLALLAGLALALPALAQDSLPPAPYAYQQLADPERERAARALMETLRCLKCQSQSIADSDAPMAGDMRHHVRTQIAAGQSPDEVRAWLIARYGDYVSYQPRLTGATWPLFVLPLLLLAGGGIMLARRLRR